MTEVSSLQLLARRILPGTPVADRTAALGLLHRVTRITHWESGENICDLDDPADDWFCVLSGAAHEYVVRSDGRRHIVELLLPGDFFGFTTQDRRRFAVQAVLDDTVVARYPRERAEAIADADSTISRILREQMFETIERLREQLLVVGRTSAVEKVGSFLLRMSERLPYARLANGDDGIALPITRYDIADQLGLSAETVSRAISELKSDGAIALGGPRMVSIVDRRGLEERREHA
jgi:CRP/FNR family nitrogen fixation transcriptional regulator